MFASYAQPVFVLLTILKARGDSAHLLKKDEPLTTITAAGDKYQIGGWARVVILYHQVILI